MKLIIYIPAYNEEENIGKVISNLPKNIDQIDEISILVVDDGSLDDTSEIAKNRGAEIVSHNKNRGVGIAFQSAVMYALNKKADILVSIDADGQFSGSQIPNMVKLILLDQADMVTGNRFVSGMPKTMPWIKYWGNKQMSRLISLLAQQKFMDVSCGFRAYNKEALLNLNLIGAFTYTQETILDMAYKGLRVVEIPVNIKYFQNRKSRVAGNILNYAYRTTKILLRTLRDYKPMLFFGGAGGISLLIGLFFEIFMLRYYFINGVFTPYKSFGFIGLGFLIFGLLLVIVGLLADMFNRIRVNQERILYDLNKRHYEK